MAQRKPNFHQNFNDESLRSRFNGCLSQSGLKCVRCQLGDGTRQDSQLCFAQVCVNVSSIYFEPAQIQLAVQGV